MSCSQGNARQQTAPLRHQGNNIAKLYMALIPKNNSEGLYRQKDFFSSSFFFFFSALSINKIKPTIVTPNITL